MRLIDADRLLTRKMKSKYYHLPNGDIAIPIIDIERAPTVKSERKKGMWIKEDLSGYLTPGGNSIYHCSECGHEEGPYPFPRLTDFCPSCGCDMRGKE